MTSASPLQSPLQDSAVSNRYPRHSDLWSAARKPEIRSFWIEANLRPLSCLETFEVCRCTGRCPASTSVHSLPPLLRATTTTTTRCIHGYGFLEQSVHFCQNDLREHVTVTSLLALKSCSSFVAFPTAMACLTTDKTGTTPVAYKTKQTWQSFTTTQRRTCNGTVQNILQNM